nr:hypothetical protein [Helicobacter cetorum]
MSKILSVTQPGITTYPQLINQIAYFQSLPLFLQNLNSVLDGSQLGNWQGYKNGDKNGQKILALEQNIAPLLIVVAPLPNLVAQKQLIYQKQP